MHQFVCRLVRSTVVVALLCLVAEVGHSKPTLPPLPTAKLEATDLVQTISQGDRVDIPTNLREGRWTIIEFEADWCGSCKVLKPSLMSLIHAKQSVALRRIDIVSWDSPVARQHDIQALPQLHLYDGTRLITSNRNEVMAILRQ